MSPIRGWPDSRVLEVLVVDDNVSESLRINLGEVDQLGGVVPVPMHPCRLLEAFHLGIAGDTPIEGNLGVNVQPDAVVPQVVVLRPECEH